MFPMKLMSVIGPKVEEGILLDAVTGKPRFLAEGMYFKDLSTGDDSPFDREYRRAKEAFVRFYTDKAYRDFLYAMNFQQLLDRAGRTMEDVYAEKAAEEGISLEEFVIRNEGVTLAEFPEHAALLRSKYLATYGSQEEGAFAPVNRCQEK